MPIPNLLVGPSLLPSRARATAASPESGGWPELMAATAKSLEHLSAQRSALLSTQLPRIAQLWSAAGAQHAQETFEETLGFLTSPTWPGDDGNDLAVETLASAIEHRSHRQPAAEYVRLNAIKSAADDGVRKLAHARLRLSTIARRLEPRLRSNDDALKLIVAERRALESAARLAAAAAAAARHPVLAEDGGINRRYSAALRQLPTNR